MTRIFKSARSFPIIFQFPGSISVKNSRYISIVKPEEKKKINDIKRVERVEKRFPEKIQEIQENRALQASFQKHRQNIVKLLDSSANIEALFNGKLDAPQVQTYDELTDIISLTYYDEIQNSIMYLVSMLINSVLVELNIRRRFSPHDLPPITHHSLFLYRDIIKDSKDEEKKVEILKLLSYLYPKEEGVPESFEQFFKLLDHASVFQLMNKDLKSDSFNSLETSRLHFMHYMSSQYLNYEHGDYLNSMQLNRFVDFQSPEIKDDDIQTQFSKSFASYINFEKHRDPKSSSIEKQKEALIFEFPLLDQNHIQGSKLNHLRLALELCLTLLQTHKFTPSHKIFTSLMDKFGEVGLYHYQSLVLGAMTSYKDKLSLLSEGQLNARHFIEMVEKEPLSLASLAKYYGLREGRSSFQQLLALFRFEEIMQHERVLHKSYISSLVSKSRFLRNKEQIVDPVAFETNEAVFVPVEAIYAVIQTCILLQQYQYIDHLVNKLLMHSVLREGAIYIALRLGEDQTSLLISQTDDPEKLAAQVFTKSLFKILIRASRESDDLGRMMWILPHLDQYLEHNLHESNVRILHQKEEEMEDNESKSMDLMLDKELVFEIYKALRLFSLEGKLAFYDGMFGIMLICVDCD